jgi:hypothetical protein
VRIVGSMLVRNEDVFVERVVRSAAHVCDRIHAFDHMSEDATWKILTRLSRELDHLEVRRGRDARVSHRVLEQYVATNTWVLALDGDTVYDPQGLAQLASELRGGAHRDVFRLSGHSLNCDELDLERGTASGYMSPPSRWGTKLFNLYAVTSWSGCPQRLLSGTPVFRPGYTHEARRELFRELSWEDDPLRTLHLCFLPRSSLDGPEAVAGRLSLGETGLFQRSPVGRLRRWLRPPITDPRVAEYRRRGTNWKQEWYRLGERVTVDVRPFLGEREPLRGAERVERAREPEAPLGERRERGG